MDMGAAMSYARRLISVLVGAGLVAGCVASPVDDASTGDPPEVSGAAGAVERLARAYEQRDSNALSAVLVDQPARNAVFRFVPNASTHPGAHPWDVDHEIAIHQRMFAPEHMERIVISLRRVGRFSERHDLYSRDHGADGKLDPRDWSALDALFTTSVFFDTTGEDDFIVEQTANFVIVEDLTRSEEDASRFLILECEDLCRHEVRTAAVHAMCWSQVKQMFAPPVP